jgi:hypothetical protein
MDLSVIEHAIAWLRCLKATARATTTATKALGRVDRQPIFF